MKIFGIGYAKTGTTTLNYILNSLGFKALHNNEVYSKKNPILLIKNQLKDYSAFSDSPIFQCYPDLDKEFEGSKFILTIRDEEKWYKSWCNHHFLKEIYSNKGNRVAQYSKDRKNHWLEVYRKHNERAIAYFKERPNDLLVIDITKSKTTYEDISSFLNVDTPSLVIPHLNRISSNNNSKLKTLHLSLNSHMDRLQYFLSSETLEKLRGQIDKFLKEGLSMAFFDLSELRATKIRFDPMDNEGHIKLGDLICIDNEIGVSNRLNMSNVSKVKLSKHLKLVEKGLTHSSFQSVGNDPWIIWEDSRLAEIPYIMIPYESDHSAKVELFYDRGNGFNQSDKFRIENLT